jgi:hypothetical protein
VEKVTGYRNMQKKWGNNFLFAHVVKIGHYAMVDKNFIFGHDVQNLPFYG